MNPVYCRAWRVGVLATLIGSGAGAYTRTAAAQPVPIRAELLVTGVNAPVLVTSPRADPRLFIVQQDGNIRIFKDGSLVTAPFLTVPVYYSGEAGLLGLAFAPDYATSGFFYVYASSVATPREDRVVRYHVSATNPDLADPDSAQIVLSTGGVANHNGGWMGFSPVDGYLWVSSGERGSGSAAQNLTNAMGKMLRIEPTHDDYPENPARNFAVPPTNPFAGHATNEPAIHDYGLRNPWRCSFDRATGDLIIGDVGSTAAGEINFQPSGAPFPRNYGWPNCDAGSVAAQCSQDGRTPHVWTYPRTPGNHCATVGGYIYRGAAMPGWQGLYFFGDYCSGRVWTIRINRETLAVTDFADRSSTLSPTGSGSLSGFGEDAYGELYMCRLFNDSIWRIIPSVPVGPDCDRSGVRDAVEIARGLLPDANGDGLPDGCSHCTADFNRSGTVETSDLYDYFSAWTDGVAAADINGENAVSVQDLYDFLLLWWKGCPV